MSQPTQDLNSFFTGGGGRSISWKGKPDGTTVTGVIEAVHPPQQVTDPSDGKLKFKKNGDPIMQVRIDLQTDYRNFEMCKPPEDADEVDDGRRSLYVGGWMTGAIGDALRKAGRRGSPEIGARLSVTLTERTPNRDLNPTNKFSATYTPPSAAATQQFFSNDPQTPATPNGLSAPAADPLPPKPAKLSDEAWAALPDDTKRQVAKSMDDIPF